MHRGYLYVLLCILSTFRPHAFLQIIFTDVIFTRTEKLKLTRLWSSESLEREEVHSNLKPLLFLSFIGWLFCQPLFVVLVQVASGKIVKCLVLLYWAKTVLICLTRFRIILILVFYIADVTYDRLWDAHLLSKQWKLFFCSCLWSAQVYTLNSSFHWAAFEDNSKGWDISFRSTILNDNS